MELTPGSLLGVLPSWLAHMQAEPPSQRPISSSISSWHSREQTRAVIHRHHSIQLTWQVVVFCTLKYSLSNLAITTLEFCLEVTCGERRGTGRTAVTFQGMTDEGHLLFILVIPFKVYVLTLWTFPSV